MSQESSKQNTSPIVIRSIAPKLGPEVPKKYFFDNPYLTHLLNSLSLLFPAGEDGFVKSVQHYKSEITDKKLRQEIKAFTGQELLHSKIHEDYNQWISEITPHGKTRRAKQDHRIAQVFARMQSFSPTYALASTVALEHMTATLAAALLKSPALIDGIHKEPRKVWIWHAIEEIEHRSVAFDVYQQISGSYGLRCLALIQATMGVIASTLISMVAFLWGDKELFNGKALVQFLKTLLGKGGYLRLVAPAYGRFFLKCFHPAHEPYESLVLEWQEKLAQIEPVKVNGKLWAQNAETARALPSEATV